MLVRCSSEREAKRCEFQHAGEAGVVAKGRRVGEGPGRLLGAFSGFEEGAAWASH